MSGRFLNKAGADEIVKALTIKAVMGKSLFSANDRILIAVSGGKDSSVLAWALSAIRPALKFSYELSSLHISTDFCACCKKSTLAQRLEDWGIPFTDLFVPVIGRLQEGRKMNCYWCSTQRRTELLRYAVENGFNKIALGHHMDDIVETFFMNLCSKGRMEAMPMSIKYRKFPVTLIRPLGLLEEKQVIACADKLGILKTACTCPYGINSGRRVMRKQIDVFTGGSGDVKRRILKALAEGDRDYLIG
ncbi:MAG: tRNA 2-thiocytidine biosynthesis TtcA family protein [Spirochaetes bacterium]|nr:tRNA 2-thiocytidine biosynthesis TtcA family protein [Spirochaetota bacterium]